MLHWTLCKPEAAAGAGRQVIIDTAANRSSFAETHKLHKPPLPAAAAVRQQAVRQQQ
jgi:hypothetical protein